MKLIGRHLHGSVVMWKRVFSKKQPQNLSKSIRCTEVMWDALEKLASEHGETANGYIVLVLDNHLQQLVREGKLEQPDIKDDARSVS